MRSSSWHLLDPSRNRTFGHGTISDSAFRTAHYGLGLSDQNKIRQVYSSMRWKWFVQEQNKTRGHKLHEQGSQTVTHICIHLPPQITSIATMKGLLQPIEGRQARGWFIYGLERCGLKWMADAL